MSMLFADLPVVTTPPRSAPAPRPSRAKPKRDKTASFGTIITDPERFRIESQRKLCRCLSCDDDFVSHGPGNRVCLSCKALDAWTSPNEFSVAAAF
jgi:hypothetical protein